MPTQPHEASVAYTYAWWLTGDDQAAEAAVHAAIDGLPDLDDVPDRTTVLLRAVRRVAAPERTMCPASELALLHDGHDIALDLAADLVEIAGREARTELAHGRLEALLETVRDPFAHPERLGGLAVGNPPDVAHSRTCDSCAAAVELLRRGRQELHALPTISAPPTVLARMSGLDEAAGAAAVAADTEGPVADRTVGSDQDGRDGRRRPVGGLIAVAIGILVVLAAAVANRPSTTPEVDPAPDTADEPVPDAPEDQGTLSEATEPGAPSSGDEGAGAAGATAPGPTDEEQAAADELFGDADAAAPLDGFTVTEAGVLPTGASVAVTDAPSIDRDQPLRVAVRFAGGAKRGIVDVTIT